MGRGAGCRRLAFYGEALAREAEAYAVARIAARINDFPVLVRSIAEEVPSATTP
jgi:hypothetical protein